jgi:hypothetical protein
MVSPVLLEARRPPEATGGNKNGPPGVCTPYWGTWAAQAAAPGRFVFPWNYGIMAAFCSPYPQGRDKGTLALRLHVASAQNCVRPWLENS